MPESRDARWAGGSTLGHADLLRGLQCAVDEVFATMLSTLGVGSRVACLLDVQHPVDEARVTGHVQIESRVDIRGPLEGWISLSCSAQTADDLARGLLRLGPNELLSRTEVEDALCECANMIAGALKTSLLDPHGCFAIGIPRLSSVNPDTNRMGGSLVYGLCSGTLHAELWLDRRPEND